jgi:preprotein translocase subunit SecY
MPQGAGTPLDATSSLTFKINNAGIVPICFSGAILLLPATIKNIYHLQDGFIANLASALQWDTWKRVAAGGVVITIFCFVYVALVLSPKKMGQDLERHRGVVPDVAPGQATVDHLDRVLTWTTLVGALYLWVVSMLPSYIAWIYFVPLRFSGASLMVVVCVAIDALQQACAFWPSRTSATSTVNDGSG